MKKYLTLIAVVVFLLTASGCGGTAGVERTVTPINPAIPTVIPTSKPTNTPAPTDTPTLQQTTEGKITGILVDQSTQQGIPDIELCLSSYNPETGVFGVPSAPPVITDAQGVFLFEGLQPGYYLLFSISWGTFWDDSLGNLKSFEVQPGEITDLGQIVVDH